MTLKYDYVQVSEFVHLENVCSKQIMKRSCHFKITHARCNINLILHFSIHVCMCINKLSMLLIYPNGIHVICLCAVRVINLIAIRSFKYVLCTCVLFRDIHLCAIISYFVPVNYSCCLSVCSFVLLTCSLFVLFTCRYSCFFTCVLCCVIHMCAIFTFCLCTICSIHLCYCAICFICAIYMRAIALFVLFTCVLFRGPPRPHSWSRHFPPQWRTTDPVCHIFYSCTLNL